MFERWSEFILPENTGVDYAPCTSLFFMRSAHGRRKQNFRGPSTKWATKTEKRGPSKLCTACYMRSEHGRRNKLFVALVPNGPQNKKSWPK